MIMENNGEWEKMKNMINELMTEGRDYAQQLQLHLSSSSSSSNETREELAKKILESYQKSLNIMNSGEPQQDSSHFNGGGSPKSYDSDQDHQADQRSKNEMPRWKQKVRITPGAGMERSLDDGFSWRKYGQKDILGARFPRGYYRCTHRHSQGCLATKQVQRSDNDPMLFDVTYRGTHTCSQSSNSGGSTFPSVDSPVQNPTMSQEHQKVIGNLRIATEGLPIDDNSPYQEHHPHLPSPLNALDQLGDIDDGTYGTGLSYHTSNYSFPISHFHQEIGHDVVSMHPSTSNSPTATGLDSPFRMDQNFGGFLP